MNFTEKQIESLILHYENLISDKLSDLVSAEMNYNAAKEALLEAQMYHDQEKEKYERMKVQHSELTGLLQNLVKMRSTGSTEIRVIRQTSHLDKPAKLRTRIMWQKYAAEILKEADRFMTLADLFSTIQARDYVKNPDEKLFRMAIEKVKTRPDSDIKFYKDKLGLASWFNGETPFPHFIKDFMYANA